MDFRTELAKWGYNKGDSIDVEILVNEILPSLFTKQEQKQHLIDMMKLDENFDLYEMPEQTDEKGQPLTYWGGLAESKQETLEEAAERLYPNGCDGTDRSAEIYRRIFIEGAKWQQKKICDSEVIQKIRASKSDAEARRIIKTV